MRRPARVRLRSKLSPLFYTESDVNQVVLRLLTFLANSYLIRLVSAEVLGVVYVRLTLLLTTTLFLSREPLRKVSFTKHSPEEWPKLVGLIWLALPVSVCLAVILSLIWMFILEPPPLLYYKLGCVVFGASALIELLGELPYIYLVNNLHIKAPLIAEGTLQITRTVVTIALAHYSTSILPFIIGHLISAVVTTCLLWGMYFMKVNKTDKVRYEGIQVSSVHLRLAVSFTKQSILKQLLTEGEAYVMTLFPIISFAQQGVFSTISRLASIVMRVGFKNIEDSYYLLFAQMLKRGLPLEQQNKDALQTCKETLGNLLRFMTFFGIIITMYGLSFARVALLLYGGKKLADTEATFLLQLYCPYIYACGVNGISEAFFFSIMSQVEVEQHNYRLLVFSVVFLGLSIVLSYILGTPGFILANIANMVIRITVSLRYITSFYNSADMVYRMVPNIPQVMLIVVCGGTALLSKFVLEIIADSTLGYILHVLIGGLSVILVLQYTWLAEDQSFKLFIKSILPNRVRQKLE